MRRMRAGAALATAAVVLPGSGRSAKSDSTSGDSVVLVCLVFQRRFVSGLAGAVRG
jgi:hypothetical protein